MSNDYTQNSELIQQLKQSLAGIESKKQNKIEVQGPRRLSRDETQHLLKEMLKRLGTLNKAHDLIPFEDSLREEWIVLAYQELVQVASQFIYSMSQYSEGTQKQVCEEWQAALMRLKRKGLTD